MKKWMQRGSEDEKRKKRYIHRYLALPPGVNHGDEEKELLIQFAHQYVQALLTYCSDDLKPGMFFFLVLSFSSCMFTNCLCSPGYHIMSVRTTREFKRLPVGKVASVYFHSIDVVLGRKELVRRAWQARCHLPKIMFHPKKGRRGSRTSGKLQNYGVFKRMLAVKPAVYQNHRNMLRLYEKYCEEAETTAYWGDDSDDDGQIEDIDPAEDPHEEDCDDEF